MQFTYGNTTKIQFGQNQIASIKDLIDPENKVLVIYGGGSIKQNGIYQQVSEALKHHKWLEFSGVEANPTVETLNNAVDIAKQEGIDFILAVGGGSVIDGAKYVAAAAKYAGDGWKILTGQHTVTQAIPLGVVLTLPATGSESNAGAVVTRAATQEKLFFNSPAVQPVFAVMDPDAMKTLPPRQLANGIVDAFIHVSEQYITFPTGALVQEGYAEALLKSLLQLGKTFNQQDDLWRANLMWTANQALNGLIGAGVAQDWATHMIGHELTALYGVDHARSLAMIHPSLLRNQIENKRAKLEQMAVNVFSLHGDNLAEKAIESIEAFYLSLDVATQLTEYGDDKNTAIESILEKLNLHGHTNLGERNEITLEKTRDILEQAIS